MPKLTPKYVTCPACGRTFTNRGYRNHVNKCKNLSRLEKKTIIGTRQLPK